MKKDLGFTLLEVLIALLIFSVVLSTMIAVFCSHIQRNTRSEQKTAAMAAAQHVLDQLRLADPTTMPSSGTSDPENITVDGKTFQVTTTYCENAAFCTTNNNRHIKVEVKYNSESLFALETVYTLLR